MNPRDAVRCTPPLLPSTSLSGLEQVVPPDRPLHSSVGPSWKFKPLPELPTGSSREDSKGNTEKQVVSGHARTSLLDDKGISSSRRCRDDILLRRAERDANLPHNSSPTRGLPTQNSSAGFETAKRPVLDGQEGQPSRFTSAKLLHSDTAQEVPIIKNPIRSKQGDTATPATSDSAHPSLVPPPLVIDGVRIWNPEEKRSPLLPTPNSSGFCHCQLPHLHPRHLPNTGSKEGISDSGKRRLHQASTRWPAGHCHSPKQNIVKGKDSRRENIEGAGFRQSVGSQFPNRTQLYSFSSSAASSNRETYNDDSDTNDDEYGINYDPNDEACHLTHPPLGSRSASHLRGHPLSRHPFIQRPKQLAIPPTEYQKHGSKIWSSQNKQERAALFPRCVRKLLPRSWRPAEETNEKSLENGKTNAVHSQQQRGQPRDNNTLPVGGTPSAMFSLSPPPRPPRPPSPPLPYMGLTSSPSLPCLTHQRGLHTNDYLTERNVITTTGTNGFVHVAPTPALTPPLTGGSTTSTWGLSNEMPDQPSSRGNSAVMANCRERGDAKTARKRMKAKSEELLNARRPRAVIDEAGNCWV